jgi:hypothetical protein
LRANGILLLQDLVNTYKPRNVPEVIAAKTSQFWGSTKRSQFETVDEYYNRFHELLDELSDADEVISVKSAMRHFIFTLGSEFEAIQQNFQIGNLPSNWHTDDWPTLLVLCRDYFTSIKPYGINKSNASSDQIQDRMAQRKKVKEWFLNPKKFAKEIEAEQCCHPGKCIFHLTKSHQTSNCDLKKECDKIVQSKRSSSSASTSFPNGTGQLCHLTEESADKETIDEADEPSIDSSDEPNDTNDDLLTYFSRVSKHYLRLVKSTPALITRHSMRFPIIADSGANFHMFRDQAFLETLNPFSGKAILGDGQTTLNIQGIGTVKLKIGEHVLSIDNVRYIPDLAKSIYSLFLHIRTPNHGLRSSFEDGLHIIFSQFSTKAVLGADDVYLNAVPVNYSTDSVSSCPIGNQGSSNCNHITQLSPPTSDFVKKEDNLLRQLRQYYGEIKTKRQLNMEVPAGFREISTYQRQVRDHHLLHGTSSIIPEELKPESSVLNLDSTDTTSLHPPTTPLPNLSSEVPVPILRCVDKPSSSLPAKLTFTEDFLRASVGFCCINTLKAHLGSLYEDTVKLDQLPQDAILDSGDLANLKKSPRNTTPVPRPARFAEVIHMDIVFGPDIAIGNVHYGLLFTDRYSCMTYLYPLQNLTTDIRKQLESFFAHLGFTPQRLITDFDTKLIGGKAREYLNSLANHVNAAPSNCQDHNGLAERHWQTIVYEARSQISLRDCVLRHISAHGLKSLVAPTSLKAHKKLDESDNLTWDATYDEEYDGLESLPTWEVITESQFKQLSKGRKALPTMAIATIKYDANNHLKRAKYRSVVLGNHDYHTWSNEEIAAPVMSQMELRLLTSLAVYYKWVLKNCDIKQAFIQSRLPSDEEYFLRPPPGCTRSQPGEYWRLL